MRYEDRASIAHMTKTANWREFLTQKAVSGIDDIGSRFVLGGAKSGAVSGAGVGGVIGGLSNEDNRLEGVLKGVVAGGLGGAAIGGGVSGLMRGKATQGFVDDAMRNAETAFPKGTGDYMGHIEDAVSAAKKTTGQVDPMGIPFQFGLLGGGGAAAAVASGGAKTPAAPPRTQQSAPTQQMHPAYRQQR